MKSITKIIIAIAALFSVVAQSAEIYQFDQFEKIYMDVDENKENQDILNTIPFGEKNEFKLRVIFANRNGIECQVYRDSNPKDIEKFGQHLCKWMNPAATMSLIETVVHQPMDMEESVVAPVAPIVPVINFARARGNQAQVQIFTRLPEQLPFKSESSETLTSDDVTMDGSDDATKRIWEEEQIDERDIVKIALRKSPVLDSHVYCAKIGVGARVLNENTGEIKVINYIKWGRCADLVNPKLNPTTEKSNRLKALKLHFDFPKGRLNEDFTITAIDQKSLKLFKKALDSLESEIDQKEQIEKLLLKLDQQAIDDESSKQKNKKQPRAKSNNSKKESDGKTEKKRRRCEAKSEDDENDLDFEEQPKQRKRKII